ncbi:MAG: hypothetical protein H6900_05865 [Rhodobacter sp.]|uniref:hypothetical protein n=1 Tax=Pararhodobacter sp. TaxID=2127056 RepID=UPI001E072B8A|nr:hypothetical protein [Pararhodobacter sp.]MCB1345123.1 hypothetical protein [Paracoccaceae bacterium]MCC0072799.1 hypothetical protein [Rhodobacter sp.]HPD90906.1 hypothetical protein [Pararhodobacter sp.]
MTGKTILSRLAACACAALMLGTATTAAAQTFLGGGAIYNYTQECSPSNPSITSRVSYGRFHYRPGEEFGNPSEVSLTFTDGTVLFRRWAHLERSNSFYSAIGRQIFSASHSLYPTNPRIRVLRRDVLYPVNGTFGPDTALVFLRLRIQNYWGIPGCAVTVSGSFGRIPALVASAPAASLDGLSLDDGGSGAPPAP